jgi:outer membrane protein
MFKKSILVLFLAIPFFAFSQNTQVKLGYLDVQAIVASMPEALQVETTLKKLAEQHETEIKKMEQEYSNKLMEYQENQANWDEVIKKNRMDELQNLQVRMQNYYQSAQQGLQQKQMELQKPLQEKMQKAITEVGNENGFLYIFEVNALLFKSDQAIDVTPLMKRKLGITQ